MTDIDKLRRPKPRVRVSIVTEAGGAQEALRRTAESLVAQSFRDWSWTILADAGVVAPLEDPRIRTLQLTRRPERLREASANAQFVALVDEGVELREVALEKWLWFLVTHPGHQGVTGTGLENRAGLYRKEAIDAAGGRDAAWPRESLPWTGAERPLSLAPSEAQARERSSHHRSKAWIEDGLPFRNVLPKQGRRMMLVAPFMSLGGADRVNLEVLRGLSRRGWQLTVATTRADDHALYPTYEALTPDLFPLADVVDRFDVPRVLEYLIDSRRPDVVVISQTELGYRLLPYLRSRADRPAFVDLCHSEHEGWYGGGFPRFSVEYGPLLDRTIVVSNHLRTWMVSRGADAERIDVCHANVDHELFVPDPVARARVRQKLGIPTNESLVLWVGRMSHEKRPQLLPAISSALSAFGFEHTMVVVGDGPERAATEALAAAESGSRTMFLGELEYAALPAIYAAADVVVLPSRREGIALALFEAMSSGVPVVAANIGGQAELVTPEVGVLVDPSDEAREVVEYAAAVVRVLRDTHRRAAMSSACRARIEAEFTAASMHDRMEQALENALEQHVSSPRPAPDPVLGRLIAAEAVELMRLQERGRAGPPRDSTHRERVYLLARRLGGPLYRWALARGGLGERRRGTVGR